jgi:hypothetical protein
MKKASVRSELEFIRRMNGGVLRPKDVVDFARDESTALHARFDWDDSSAAEKYRLEQARMLIRFEVRIIDEKRVPAYFSFAEDRRVGDSYRAVVEIMRDDELREKMIAQALREAQVWAKRYERFCELRTIVAEIGRVISIQALGKKKKKKKSRLAE